MSGVMANLNERSRRAKDWQYVFGRLTNIPLKSPISCHVGIEELGDHVEIYFLDLGKVTAKEYSRLVRLLSKRTNDPADQVDRELQARGVPVLAEDVIVSIPQGLALSMMDDDLEADLHDEEEDNDCDGSDDVD